MSFISDIHIIETTHGLYYKASDIHDLIRKVLYTYPCPTISVLNKDMNDTLSEYLKRKKINEKSTTNY